MRSVSVRTCLLVVLVGSIVFWVGMPFPVGSDYFGADTDAERIVVVEENRTQIGVSFGLLGLGATIAGIGLWMLGRAIAPIEEAERGRPRKIAAQLAGWLGLLGAIGGLSRLLHACGCPILGRASDQAQRGLIDEASRRSWLGPG